MSKLHRMFTAMNKYHQYFEIQKDLRERLGVFACVMQLDVGDTLVQRMGASYTEFVRMYWFYERQHRLFIFSDYETNSDALFESFRAFEEL